MIFSRFHARLFGAMDRMKNFVKRRFWPLMPGWPDEGRRIVQMPLLIELMKRASMDSRKFRHVFNAGAGEGGYAPLLLSLPGVERSFETDFGYRTHLPQRIDPKQTFFGASLESIPLADRSIDFILCTEVLEHIEHDEQALDELTRVLRPLGWLLITVPTPPAPHDPAHVREGYRPEQLRSMLEKRSFEVLEIRRCMYFFFRFLLAHWWRVPFWCPRIFIRSLASLDRGIPVGPPMDLMVLARLTDRCAIRAAASDLPAPSRCASPGVPEVAPPAPFVLGTPESGSC
jgi:SAM-dependent methyltransferase